MYKVPIVTAALVFITATLLEIVTVEVLRGSIVEWLAEPHKLVLVLVMIGINAIQGYLVTLRIGLPQMRCCCAVRRWTDVN